MRERKRGGRERERGREGGREGEGRVMLTASQCFFLIRRNFRDLPTPLVHIAPVNLFEFQVPCDTSVYQ